MVVHHDGLLDLHLYIEVQTSVLVVFFARSDVLYNTGTAAGGTEDVPSLSTNFCGLCGCAKRYTGQRRTSLHSRGTLTVDMYENILTHDPNNHVSERSAGGLRTKRPGINCKPRGMSRYQGKITSIRRSMLSRYKIKFIALTAGKRFIMSDQKHKYVASPAYR